jgi:hypothetical protein
MYMMKLQHVLLCNAVLILIAGFALTNLSCSQYDYASPQPGTIEVRLRTISKNIDFSALNNFVLKVNSVTAVRTVGTQVEIFADDQAKGRQNPTSFNTLDPRSRDSALVIGQAFAPPGDYSAVQLSITPSSNIILNGYQIVTVKLPEGFSTSLNFEKSFSVREAAGTRIVLTIDLDSSLVKGAQVFYFRPEYFISSIGSF